MQKIIWDTIEIEINYVESFSASFEKSHDDKMSHIEIYSKEDLPITETGYKSIFILQSNLERWGGLEKYIIAELDHGAKNKDWQFKKESKRQLCLF
ncbi:MAG: hypothetical protein COB14_07480 [Alphaproteobacteria bacterium]|nr:MAG: hypothetical protein COB14_07480 [Alphaproteobacteria bacterium]